MTFRPPVILRIIGWTVTIGGLFFLICGAVFLSGLAQDSPARADAPMMTTVGGVLFAVGLFIALKSSVVLHLGPTSLWYRKYLVARGAMTYDDIATIKVQPGPAQSVSIRDVHGRSVAINAFSVNWEPILTWATEHGRTDITKELG